MNELDENYWNNRYENNTSTWDLGEPSPPLVHYFNQLTNKNIAILIPGGGNSYEAEYLLKNNFTNVTIVDISSVVCQTLTAKYAQFIGKGLTVLHKDFFELSNTYDLIIEQIFFCAIDPSLRKKYVEKMHQLLNKNGKLVGLFFNRTFDGGPPFSGSKAEYENLFQQKFTIHIMDVCYNSVKPRAGVELFVNLEKK